MPGLFLAIHLVLALGGTLPADDHPARLEYFNGNGLFGSESVRWSDGRLIWITLGHNGVGARDTREEAVPPPAAWRTFWRRVDAIGAWSWDSSYQATSSARAARDGYVWKVAIVHDGRTVVSSGYNAMAPKAAELRDALHDLFIASRRVGREWEPDRLEVSASSGPGPRLSYEWRPTRVAVTSLNLEARRAEGRTRTEPADPQVHLEPGALTVRIIGKGGIAEAREVTPSRVEWERFWARLDAQHWWHSLPDSVVSFEWSWSVALWHGDDRVTAKGRSRPGVPPAVEAIRAAMAQLVADATSVN